MLVLVTAIILCPAPGRTASEYRGGPPAKKVVPNACDGELSVASMFADLGEWKDAEAHFTAATKEEKCRQQGLAGIKVARTHEEAILLRAGQIYEGENQWSKAADLYRAVASDSSIGDATRNVANERLRSVLLAQAREKRWSGPRDSVSEWVKDAFELIVFVLSLFLLVFTARSIWKSRRVILIHPFDAPTDELAKGMNIQMRYARVTMNNPAFSSAAQMPPFLIENLRFSDEVEPIEDLEIAGSKIPFSSLGKLFGRPRVRVTGGFDGIAPVGNAYSFIQTYDSNGDAFIRHEIRIGVPSEQRLDLLNFAYDVIVKASSANSDV
jgi:hypothetical protein